VVDDEVAFANALADALVRDHIDVEIEHDGSAGLWRATEGSFDVIVLDVMLPGMSGYEVCRRLRAAEIWTPVLMLTAKAGDLDEVESFEMGADDHLRKPFSLAVLIARLRSLARLDRTPRPLELRVGPLAVHPARATAVRDGVEIPLSRRELAVLEMLVRAAGDPVATQRIVDHVWGFDESPQSNVVPVTIGYLRRKVDDPFDRPLIETVRNVGYRIAVEA
jgi:DNA-binding response OmpR family regulator